MGGPASDPLGAARGASSLITKNLTGIERPETITVWLLVLLTPINGGLALAAGFEVPAGVKLGLFVLAGLLTVLAQYFLTLAYTAADAAYGQPFDDLKLPLNVFAGWPVFGYAPTGYLWLGAALIFCASLFIMRNELRREQTAASNMAVQNAPPVMCLSSASLKNPPFRIFDTWGIS
ncbi:hypothetical protein EV128_12144 [Rhizobium azibense]|nr:hypothetical protein EV128_12144 [Rhizobium azibense]